MRVPDPDHRQAQPARGGSWAVFLTVVMLVLFGWFSVCAGVAYLAFPPVRSALEYANVPVPRLPLGKLPPQLAPNDWWTSRVLSEIYTRALNVVVEDPTVIERLGEPIEIDLEAEELYRRSQTGAVGAGPETIEFDIKGPKGSAVVTVVSKGAGISHRLLPIDEIKVTLEDGTVLDVPPPSDQQFAPR
jgi:hypothetical protein